MKDSTDNIKLIHGDSLEIMREMDDNIVDVSFTSPPYNRKRNDKYQNYNDNKEEYFEFLVQFIDHLIRITKGNVFVNIQKTYYNKEDVFKLFGHYANQICEVFVWEKSNPMPASGFAVTNSYEFIIVFGKEIKSNKTYTKNHLTTSVAKMPKEHKAVMHKAVSDFFISNFTKEQDIVFDPFMGTGTTGLTCKQLNRKFIGIELSEQYFIMTKERIEG